MQESKSLTSGTSMCFDYRGTERRPVDRIISDRIQFELMVETLAAGSLGRDECERDRIVQSFCRAAQLFGVVGERRLLNDLNGGLQRAGSSFSLSFGGCHAITAGARALELIDLRVKQSRDRMIFGVLLA
jgi:hypothetical protein